MDLSFLAHAMFVAESFIGDEHFVTYLGDNLLKQGIAPLVETYHNNSSDCIIHVTPVKNPGQYGVVEMDKKETHLVW